MTENVITQKLRDFTVQIRVANTETIIGTGIVISPDGKVVTCAHVVKSAGVEPREINGKELDVYFPQALGGEKKDHKAKVVAFFPDFDDDIVLLQLTDGSAPLGPERMPVLGTAEKSQGNAFRSYGYRQLEDYIAGWADGKIQGHVEPPPKRKVLGEPVQLESNQINRGMSGSAVLDIDRNLVVGIISEAWFPDKSLKDSNTAWAVDSYVLSLAPLGLAVQDASLALKAAPVPKFDVVAAQAAVSITQKHSWNNAPAVLDEWTGRYELLKQITEDWNNRKKYVTGLIGFGGEGKSSLARKWVDNLLNDSSQLQPDGIFWWGFYENRSVDEFLETALKYMSSGKIDPRQIQSSNLRAQVIGAMLNAGRYLFVLDGLEVMQHQGDDQYGLLISNDLRDLLTYFARPDNQSFCLITSRAPLIDLMDYTTYTHRDVDRLSKEDGRALLQRLDVKGDDALLDKVVSEWDGHALILSILAGMLVDKFSGDINKISDLPAPTSDEPRYERVYRVLHRYDEYLTDFERSVLIYFSALRLPVRRDDFREIFEIGIGKKEFNPIVGRLVELRLLHFFDRDQSSSSSFGGSSFSIASYYFQHPLVRAYYYQKLFSLADNILVSAHVHIAKYYLKIAASIQQNQEKTHDKGNEIFVFSPNQNFDFLTHSVLGRENALIESIYHACCARAYNDAFVILIQELYEGDKRTFVNKLGKWQQSLDLLTDFFPEKNTSEEPLVREKTYRRWILNEMGLCLMKVGHLHESTTFYERKNKIALEMEDWYNISRGYQNLTELYIALGKLDAAALAAFHAFEFAQRAGQKWDQASSLAFQGWILHLQGNTQKATDIFKKAEILRSEDGKESYLFETNGVYYARHLCQTGHLDYSRHIAEVNLTFCEINHFAGALSQCHCMLGDLDSDSGKQTFAHPHYESALKIARSVQNRDVLIEALVARGRFYAKHMKNAIAAFSDLNEALGYCVESGYRIYEADTRVALSWAYLADNEKQKAKKSAEHALQMSNEMGYYWGKMDSNEMLKAISH